MTLASRIGSCNECKAPCSPRLWSPDGAWPSESMVLGTKQDCALGALELTTLGVPFCAGGHRKGSFKRFRTARTIVDR